MKVLLVEFSPSGGLYQFAFQLGDAMAQLGHEVELLTGPDPELASRHDGMRVLSALPTWHPGEATRPPAPVRLARRAWRAGRHVEAWRRVTVHAGRHRPDVVIWGEWRFALDGWLASAVVRRLAASMVFADLAHTPRPFNEQRTSGSLLKREPGLLRALAAAYDRLDVVFVLGERSRQLFTETFPSAGPVVVIAHGDEGVFLRGSVPPAAQTEPLVLFFGTLARYKGLDLLLDAFALVRQQVPQARLLVAGAVADIDFASLAERAQRVPGVELRPGYVPATEVAQLLGAARVVVAPYVLANQSGVVHLAQTFARPVVATDVGDLRQAVRHGQTGLLVPPADPPALAASLVSLLTDPAAARAMGDRGRERLEAESSWLDVARSVLAACAEAAAAKPHRPRVPPAAPSGRGR